MLPTQNSVPDFIPVPDASPDFIPLQASDDSAVQTAPPAPAHPVLSAMDKFLSPEDETANLSAYDPNTLHGYGARTAQALKGIGAGIKGLFTAPFPGTENNPINWNPVTQASKDIQGIKDWNELRKVNPDYAWGNILGPMLVTHVASKLLTPAGMAAKLTRGTGGMAADIEPTVNDLRAVTKDVNAATGKPYGPPSTVGDFIDHTSLAESKLNSEYANTLGPHANDPGPVTPNGTFPVADSIRSLKDRLGNTTAQDKAARAYIDHVASEFDKPLSLDELNRQRIAANNRLYSFEKKSDVAQYAAAGSNAGTAVDKAIANTVRDVVYPKMDQIAGKPDGYFRDLQNRVGNLFRLQSDAQDYARAVHQKTMIARGSTPIERIKPGGAVSAGGGIHGYLSNLPAIFKAPNPEGAADAAVQAAYGWRQRIAPPNPGLSLPVSALIGMIRGGKLGENHPLSQSQPKQ